MAFPTARSYVSGAETVNTPTWDVNYPGASPPTGQTSAILDGGGSYMEAGDLALWACAADGSARSFSNFDTTLTWTSLKAALSDGSVSLNIWYRILTGSETTNGQIWQTGSGLTCSGSEQGPWRMTIFKNFFGSGGITVSTGATGATANPDPDEVSWGWTADSLVRCMWASDASRATTAYPSGYTINQFDDNSGGGAGAALGSAAAQFTSSPQNPGQATIDTSDGWAAATVALRGVADAYQPRYGFVNYQNPGVFAKAWQRSRGILVPKLWTPEAVI